MYRIIGADNKEYGPVSIDVLKQWIIEGRVNEKTLVKAEGETHWRQLSTYPELFALLTPQQQQPPLPPSQPPPFLIGQPPVSRPATTNNMAVASLIMGILSVLFCCCCFGMPFNILSIIFGVLALNQIKNDPTQTGREMAIIGIALGVFSCLIALALTIFSLISGGYEEFLREYRRWKV